MIWRGPGDIRKSLDINVTSCCEFGCVANDNVVVTFALGEASLGHLTDEHTQLILLFCIIRQLSLRNKSKLHISLRLQQLHLEDDLLKDLHALVVLQQGSWSSQRPPLTSYVLWRWDRFTEIKNSSGTFIIKQNLLLN